MCSYYPAFYSTMSNNKLSNGLCLKNVFKVGIITVDLVNKMDIHHLCRGFHFHVFKEKPGCRGLKRGIFGKSTIHKKCHPFLHIFRQYVKLFRILQFLNNICIPLFFCLIPLCTG